MKNRVGLCSTLCLAIAWWSGKVIAQNLNPNAGNKRFDPANPGDISSCEFPPLQDVDDYIMPAGGQCAERSAGQQEFFSPEKMKELAVKYSPVLFFHPSEPYTLSSVDFVFSDPSAGKILGEDGVTVLVDSLDLTELPGDSNINIERNELDEFYLAGEGYDKNGMSNGKVYFNYISVGNNTNTWVINYYYYYPYSGSVDMAFTANDGVSPDFMYLQVRPFGEHEGDWESISVMICAADEWESMNQPLAVHYHHRSWSYLTDCTKGECNFYMNSETQPVGFVVRSHHSTYPFPSQAHFYGNIDLNLASDLAIEGAFWILDITTQFQVDETPMFIPSDSNVVHIDPDTDEAFQFGGRWGKAGGFDKFLPGEWICWDKDQLQQVECPENPLLKQTLELFETFGSMAGSFLPPDLVPIVLAYSPGPYGPTSFPNYDDWIAPRNAQIFDFQIDDVDPESFCSQFPEPTYGEVPEVVVDDTSAGGSTASTVSPTIVFFGLMVLAFVQMFQV